MRNTAFLLRTAGLLILTSVFLTGCHNGVTEKQYVSSANDHDRLTLTSVVTNKSRLIATFHGVTMGSFTIENDEGVLASGTFREDENGLRFETDDERLSVKVNSDGSFDYAKRTWREATGLLKRNKELKARADGVRSAAASQEESSR